MTYLFGTNTYLNLSTAPIPQYEVDTDGVAITVTHCKSGILSTMLSLDTIKEKCHGHFEEISQFILSHIPGAIADNLVVNFTDRAQFAISNITRYNRHMAPCFRVGKF